MRLLKDNNIFKLFIFLFIIIIAIITFTGCKNYTYDEKFIIKDKDIFKQVEEEYYVYFYKDNCKYCNDCFETVNNYLNSENDIKLFSLSYNSIVVVMFKRVKNIATIIMIE